MMEFGILLGLLAVAMLITAVWAPTAQRRMRATLEKNLDEVARALGIARTQNGAAGLVDGFHVTLG